jgi:pimeloyl-ACP methyl ester carboxylesterase
VGKNEKITMPHANNDGTCIYYEVEGYGPPLVLAHGFSDGLEGWREYGYAEVLEKEHRLILIDARGHGRSDKPYNPQAYGLEQRLADVVAVLDELGIDRAHYFGYSLGGWIGLGLAKYAPERLRSLIIGGAQPYGQSMQLYRQGLTGGIEGWVAVVEKMLGSPVTPKMKERLLSNDVQALLASVADDRPDISGILPTLTMPCLLYVGEADPLHSLVERCASEVPNGRFFSLPGLNHIQGTVRSDLVLPQVVEFLAKCDSLRSPNREARQPIL